MPDAKAIGYLDLNIAGFDQAISAAKKLLGGFVAGFTAIKLEKFFQDGITEAIKFGDEMYHASQKLGGFDPGNLLIVQKALENTGESAGNAQKIISDALHEGRKLSDIFKGSDNYAKALNNAAESYGSQAKVLTESADKLAKVWQTLQSIGEKLKTFFLSATSQFVKPLQTALEYLNKIDLAKVGAEFGKRIGDAMTFLIGVFSNGTIYKILETGLKLAFEEGVNLFSDASISVVEYLKQNLGSAFYDASQLLEQLLEDVFKNSVFNTLWNTFLGTTYKMTAALIRAFEIPILYFRSGLILAVEKMEEGIAEVHPKIAKALGIGGFKANSFGSIVDSQKSDLIKTKSSFYDKKGDQQFDEAYQKSVEAQKLFQTAIDGFNAKNIDPKKIFQTDELKKTFSKLLSDATKAGNAINAATDFTNFGKNEEIKGDPAKIIADSFAKVGGGGGYIRQGQTLQEKQLTIQTRSAKANEEVAVATRQIAVNTGKGAPVARIPRE